MRLHSGGRALAAALVLFVTIPLRAQPSNDLSPFIPQAELSAFADARMGEAKELVYGDGYLISELIWPMKPLVSGGLTVDLRWNSGFRFRLDGSAALPLAEGTMYDSDFLNSYLNGDTSKTHLSVHPTTIDFAYDCKAESGWAFRTPLRGPGSETKISITPLVGLRYQTVKWHANDGYAQYADTTAFYGSNPDGTHKPWSSDVEKQYMTGSVLVFQQESWMPYARLAVTVPAGDWLSIEPSVAGSPAAFWNDADRHVLRNKTFYDIIKGGYMLEPALKISFAPGISWSFFVEGIWTQLWHLRGDTYEHDDGTSFYHPYYAANGSGSGAELSLARVRLGAAFAFQNKEQNGLRQTFH
jgi:outer membrane protease